MVTSIGSSILTSLGASTIDTSSLVDQLATASIANKKTALTTRETANTAQISDLANAVSTINSFSTSLSSLISGGTLYTQPTSSNTSVVSVSAVAGARLSGLAATIKVNTLATAQTLSSPALTNSGTAVGQGTLTLTVGGKTATITIDSTNDSMAGLAQAIKSSGLGVTASTVTDSSGTRLVVKGATGVDNTFSLTMASGDASGIGRFTFDPSTYDPDNITGFTRTQEAVNAEIVVDGVPVSKSSNSFSDVIAGVKIDLQSAAPNSTISIGASQPADAIKQAVGDFVAAYNEARATLTKMVGTTGSLKSDSGIRELMTRLGRISSTALTYASDGSPTTLAEIGVSTNRDGSLSLDSARLTKVMTDTPDAVEAMFNPGQRSSSALLNITSTVGKVKGGIYTVTNATPGTSTTSASATLDGSYTLPNGTTGVTASYLSAANGLSFDILGSVTSATITIDPGIQGILDGIKSDLTSTNGMLTATQTRLDSEKTSIAADQDKLTARDTSYRALLSKQFTAMSTALSAYSSTQSYLEQQIKLWNSSSNN